MFFELFPWNIAFACLTRKCKWPEEHFVLSFDKPFFRFSLYSPWTHFDFLPRTRVCLAHHPVVLECAPRVPRCFAHSMAHPGPACAALKQLRVIWWRIPTMQPFIILNFPFVARPFSIPYPSHRTGNNCMAAATKFQRLLTWLPLGTSVKAMAFRVPGHESDTRETEN